MTALSETPVLNSVPQFPFIQLPPADVPPTKVENENPPPAAKKKRAPKHDFKDGRGRVFAHRHDNGGGWVEDTATVGADCYIGPTAQVMNNAIVHGRNIRIEAKSTVKGWAQVYQNTTLAGFARVGGKAKVVDSSIRGTCQIHGDAEITNSTLENHVNISGTPVLKGCRISGNVEIKDAVTLIAVSGRGWLRFKNNAICIRACFDGCAEIGGNAQVLHSNVDSFRWHTNYRQVSDYAAMIVRPEFYVTIDGEAIVQQGSRICSPVVVSNRSVLINCNFTGFGQVGMNAVNLFMPPNTTSEPPTFVRLKILDRVWRNANVESIGTLERLLADNDDTGNRNGVRTVRPQDTESPYTVDRLATGRRIVPV